MLTSSIFCVALRCHFRTLLPDARWLASSLRQHSGCLAAKKLFTPQQHTHQSTPPASPMTLALYGWRSLPSTPHCRLTPLLPAPQRRAFPWQLKERTKHFGLPLPSHESSAHRQGPVARLSTGSQVKPDPGRGVKGAVLNNRHAAHKEPTEGAHARWKRIAEHVQTHRSNTLLALPPYLSHHEALSWRCAHGFLPALFPLRCEISAALLCTCFPLLRAWSDILFVNVHVKTAA